MSRPSCWRCGAKGQIRHREPGVHYCPSLDCPVGKIPAADYGELLSIVTQRTREIEAPRHERELMIRDMGRMKQRNDTLAKRIMAQAEEIEQLERELAKCYQQLQR